MMHKALAEMAGTFGMVFVGIGGILLSEKYPHAFPAFMIPAVWGGVIALMIVVWGATSGAHFNPAVTLAFTVAKRFPAALLPLYWGSQLVGGLAAIAALEAIKKL